jgi:hypothetical protein
MPFANGPGNASGDRREFGCHFAWESVGNANPSDRHSYPLFSLLANCAHCIKFVKE